MANVAYQMATPAHAAPGAPRAHPSWSPCAPSEACCRVYHSVCFPALDAVFSHIAFLTRCTCLSGTCNSAGMTTTAGTQTSTLSSIVETPVPDAALCLLQ